MSEKLFQFVITDGDNKILYRKSYFIWLKFVPELFTIKDINTLEMKPNFGKGFDSLIKKLNSIKIGTFLKVSTLGGLNNPHYLKIIRVDDAYISSTSKLESLKKDLDKINAEIKCKIPNLLLKKKELEKAIKLAKEEIK